MEFIKNFEVTGLTGALTLTFVVVLLTTLLRRKRRPACYPPGPKALPIIGNLHQLGTAAHVTFMQMGDIYGPMFTVDLGNLRTIVLNDSASIKEAFSMSEFAGRPALYPFLMRTGGKMRGIVMAEGHTWLEQRRFTMRTLRDFGFGKKSMETLIKTEIAELIQYLSDLKEAPIQAHCFFSLAVVNSLWSIITGQRFAHHDKELMQLVKYITETIRNSGPRTAFLFFPFLCKIAPTLSGYTHFLDCHVKAIDMIRKEVNEHKKTFQEDNPRDLVDVFLHEILKTKDEHSSFYKKEGEEYLMYTLLDLFQAGLETTSTTLSWTFLYLSLHQEVQNKLFEEIQRVVGLSRLPSLSDRQNMPYTEAVIMEALRASTLLPIILHRATTDVTFHQYKLPKGTQLIGNMYAVHSDPKIWGDPENFRPERFILEDGLVNRHHESFLVFGYGKRVCLGESLARDELFLFITSLFQKFNVVPNPNKPKPSMNGSTGFIVMPKPCEYVLIERLL